MKLGLGTVQFGMPYGINNSVGKPDLQQVKNILEYALGSGITLLDTAADYGDSEETIGSILGQVGQQKFSVVTKASKNKSISKSVASSLKKLNRAHLSGLLIHDFQQYKSNPAIWEEMMMEKVSGRVKKIGFSLYFPEQLEFLINAEISLDLIQVPYSIFDQRFEPYFKELKSAGTEIHVRSVFVQGLVFKSSENLPAYFNPIKEKIKALGLKSAETQKTIQSLCLNFTMANALVDHVIIGVDSVENLRANVDAIQEELTQSDLTFLKELKEDNEEMILPFKWKL